MIDESIRQHALIAITRLQVICFSVRGLRPFTRKEYDYIFGTLGKSFFHSLSRIQHNKLMKRIEAAERYNIDKPPAKRRRVPHWKPEEKLPESTTDTASSSDDGVPPYFLRSQKVVPHAFVHLPEQVCMGGSHRFHDTVVPESSHKRNLGEAALRSRTYQDLNRSASAMLEFQHEVRLLAEICAQAKVDKIADHQQVPVARAAKGSVKLTSLIKATGVGLTLLGRGRRGTTVVDRVIHVDTWDRILHEGVPVSLRELVSLALSQLHLQDNDINRGKILQCDWSLGWHVTSTTTEGVTKHYRGGGVTPGTTSSYLRGDWVEIGGDDLYRGERTSRLARVVCGVVIRNLKQIFTDLPGTIWEYEDCEQQDYVVFLLVRYAMAHPDVGRERGLEYRPLCPGELKNTHCLWKWYERPANFRRGCFRTRPWERHKHLFGTTPEQQETRKSQERLAWYDFIQCTNVTYHANVQRDFDRPDSFLQSVMWC